MRAGKQSDRRLKINSAIIVLNSYHGYKSENIIFPRQKLTTLVINVIINLLKMKGIILCVKI